jgi:hypothetical protein
MAIDPRAWIYGFIDHVPGIIKSPARWIADRIFGMLSDGVAFARWLKNGFAYLYTKGAFFLLYVISAISEAATTLEWLTLVEIPRRAKAALLDASNYANRLVDSARNALTGAINTLRNWAQTQINKAIGLANDLRTWATAKVNAIIDKLTKTVDVWYERLTDPGKMATWLIAALMGPLLRYLYSNRDKMMTWLLQSSPAFSLWLARALEDVLRRLL